MGHYHHLSGSTTQVSGADHEQHAGGAVTTASTAANTSTAGPATESHDLLEQPKPGDWWSNRPKQCPLPPGPQLTCAAKSQLAAQSCRPEPAAKGAHGEAARSIISTGQSTTQVQPQIITNFKWKSSKFFTQRKNFIPY